MQQTTRCEPTLKNAVPGHQNDTRNKVGRQVTLDSYKSRFTIARRSGLWPYFARNIRSPLTASYRCSFSVRVGTSLIPTLLTQPPLDLRMLYGRLVFTIILYPLLLSLYRRVVRCSRYRCAAEILHIDCKRRFFLFNVYRVYKYVVSLFCHFTIFVRHSMVALYGLIADKIQHITSSRVTTTYI